MLYAEVIINNKIIFLNQCFDYIIPCEWEKKSKRGMRVIVPFGIKDTLYLGYILKIKEESKFATKFIEDFLDTIPFLNEELFLLAEEISKIPFINISSIYSVILPRSFLTTYLQKIKIIKEEALLPEIKEYFIKKKQKLKLKDSFISRKELLKLQQKGIIQIQIIINKKDYRPQPQTFYYINSDWKKIKNLKLTIKMKNDIEIFCKQNQQLKSSFYLKKDILNFFSPIILKKILDQKIILIKKKYLQHQNKINLKSKNELILKEPKQIFFWKQLNFNCYNSYLLHHNFYDDKIIIYLKLIENSLHRQKQILIIVPEIISIYFLKEKIENFFSNIPVYVFDNNNCELVENYQKYLDILEQNIFIVIGTRKIIFAPLSKIGVIIIDEENDESLIEKEKNPHYDAKELAIIRAKYHKIPLIFFTTMPSVQIFYQIKQKKIHFFDLIKIPKNKKTIQLIDMKKELKKGNLEPLSSVLLNKLQLNIKENKKTILFINTKGFSPFILCRFCSYISKCQKCNRKLVFYNKPKKILKCNFCNYKEIFNFICPRCSNYSLQNVSLGIEYIELFLKNKIKSINLTRIDSDSIKNFSEYKNILKKLDKNKIDVLLGTEMIAKNLKLPFVETVGIIMADVLLNINSFKATEKTFQIFTKMLNYISEKGEIIIQSYNLQHYVFQKFNNYNIFPFLEQVLEERKIINYPPFYFVSQILITDKSLSKILNIAQKIKEILENNLEHKIKVLKPTYPLNFYKDYNYRIILTLKYQDWPLNLNFIIEKNLNENSFISFNRFANII